MEHRPAVRDDIEFLHSLYAHELVAPNLGFDSVSIDDFPSIFDELTSNALLWIVERDKRPVAAYQTRRHRHRLAHVAYIGSLAVDPNAWGGGIGTAILKHAIERLRDEGGLRIELLVAADNPRAIAMFQRSGFVVEGKHAKYFSRRGSTEYFDELSMAWLAPELHAPEPPPAPLSADTAEHYTWGESCDGWHLVKTNCLSVIEERMPPGTSETRHAHRVSRQFFYVLDGTLSIKVEGIEHTLTARQGIEVPPNMRHQVRNTSPAEIVFLVVSQPPGQADRY